MPLIRVLWYVDKYVIYGVSIDAVLAVDESPAMAANIAMSDGRTKVAFLAVSAMNQKDPSSAVGGALQHAIIMRYMFKDDEMEQGVTGATWNIQEHWLFVAFHSGFWIATEVTKGTRRCMLQKPPRNGFCLRPSLTTVSLLLLSLHLPCKS